MKKEKSIKEIRIDLEKKESNKDLGKVELTRLAVEEKRKQNSHKEELNQEPNKEK